MYIYIYIYVYIYTICLIDTYMLSCIYILSLYIHNVYNEYTFIHKQMFKYLIS